MLVVPICSSTLTNIKVNRWPKLSFITQTFLQFCDDLLYHHILDNKERVTLDPAKHWDNSSFLQFLVK